MTYMDNDYEAALSSECQALAASIERMIQSQWGYVLTNYDDALRVLRNLKDAKLDRNEDLADVNERLRQVHRTLDERLNDITYAFKEIWEVVIH